MKVKKLLYILKNSDNDKHHNFTALRFAFV
jgi:hypothetical protein